jgi:hypothetical protein
LCYNTNIKVFLSKYKTLSSMAIATGLIGSFIVNSVASIGLSMLGNWLSPKRTDSVAENIPSVGTNQPLSMVWGSTFCNTYLFYAVPSSKAGHGDDRSSYGVLGFSNPDSTAELEAIRSNGIIVSSKTPLFNLNAPDNVIPGANKYVNQYGLLTYNNYTYKTQFATNTVNSHFDALNQAGLQYSGLTWLKVEGAERKLFGGFNSRTVLYVKNKIDTNTLTTFDVNNNSSVRVVSSRGTQGWFTIQWRNYDFTYPTGFFGNRVFAYFEGKGNTGRSVIGIGGGIEFVIGLNAAITNYVKYTVVGAVAPGNVTLPAGNYSINPLALSTASSPGTTTTAIIGIDQGQLSQVILTQAGATPLYSVNGVIKDNNDVTVYSGSASNKLYGWNGKMYYDAPNDPFDPITSSNLTDQSSPSSGTTTLGTTKLSTILKDLLQTKNVPLSRISFVNFTDKDVKGFTCTDDNVKQIILNLCTAYGKIVDEGFGNNYIFQDYPLGNNPIEIGLERHLSEPIIEYSDEANQPKEVEFTFRSWQEEYSEKSITVGYGSEFPNRSSQKIDIVLVVDEAKLLAWNQYFLLGHTNIAVRLHLDSIEGIESGSVLNLINPDTNPLKLLVGNVEIGADCTFMVNCVNFVPLNILNSSTGYLPYMISSVGVLSTPTTVDTAFRQIYLAEPRELDSGYFAGALLYTTDSVTYSSLSTNGNLVPRNTISPSTYGFKGYLSTISSNFTANGISYFEYGISSLQVSRDSDNNNSLPANGVIRIGQSWVSYTGVVTTGNTNILTGVKTGLFGSTRYIRLNEAVVDLPITNKVAGVLTTVNQLLLAKVSQGASTTFTYFQPPSLGDPNGTSVAEVTAFTPYGAPASGLVVGDLLSQYDGNGLLKIWFTNPGAIENPDFFLFPPSSSNRIEWKDFWIRDTTGSYTYLGNFDPATSSQISLSVFLSSGGYEIFQMLASGVTNPAGTFRHFGVAK